MPCEIFIDIQAIQCFHDDNYEIVQNFKGTAKSWFSRVRCIDLFVRVYQEKRNRLQCWYNSKLALSSVYCINGYQGIIFDFQLCENFVSVKAEFLNDSIKFL